MSYYQIYIDTGGTFTDCLAYAPDGTLERIKLLSNSTLRGKIIKKLSPNCFQVLLSDAFQDDIFEGYEFRILQQKHEKIWVKSTDLARQILELSTNLPSHFKIEELDFELLGHEEAPILASRIATKTPLNQDLPPISMRLGSTKGTNALLERKGAKIAFLITEGFEDLLKIRTQARPEIFALNIRKPRPLYTEVIRVKERLNADGSVNIPLETKELERISKELKKQNSQTIAVALLHSYRNPIHEEKLRQYLEKDGFKFISISSELAPTIKILPRAETAVVNAYLSKIIFNYLTAVKRKLGRSDFKIMSSAGGLLGYEFFKPKDSLLSGPAGGVVGAAESATKSGFSKILTLDMGGTSTDVARFDGDFDYKFDLQVGDANLFSPALAIETVAAGGGSICRFDGFKFTVGPESAGAFPGPACYSAGGENLTVTDVNLLLGHIDPSSFGIPVRPENAEKVLQRIKADIQNRTQKTISEREILEGFNEIANEKMAEAVRKISALKGYDPAKYSLLAFGGAGGQHACKVAELLNIKNIIIPYNAGLLSAYGMKEAVLERFAVRQVLKPLSEVNNISKTIDNLKIEAISELQKESFKADEIEVRLVNLYLRLQGQDETLEIVFSEDLEIREAFRQKYEKLYGHWTEKHQIELESIKVIVSNKKLKNSFLSKKVQTYFPEPDHFILSAFRNKKTPVYIWENLKVGARIDQKSLIISKNTTIVLEKNWNFELDAFNHAILAFKSSKKSQTENTKNIKAIDLELFTNRFRTIAEEAGAMLQRTSFSVNIKERLDFSCALLDDKGALIVNAPHIPVHLGSLGICVRSLQNHIEMQKGDVIITNHPAFGGSHLPDITLVTPIFSDENELLGYMANRAHHAEIGGKTPASMPPDAQNLEEEGVVILPAYLVKNHEVQWENIEKVLTSAKYPTRSLAENLADLKAGLASNRFGAEALQNLCREHGTQKVKYFMQELKNYASDCLTESLQQLKVKRLEATEKLDDGSKITVKFVINKNKITLDFEGSSEVHPANLNATPAIVNSAVLYVLRLFIDEYLPEKNLPLNEGLMQNVEIRLPKNSMLNPDFPTNPAQCPAVVGGNTETSQRLTDTLLKALELSACSQGTMNNLLFGNQYFGYYETIGGGVGAGQSFDGADATHQHMTNTRITDPEILEFRYPVRLNRFAIRPNSGGKGKFLGGNGTIREMTFLTPVRLTVLTQHRIEAPYGLQGGECGKIGKQYIIYKNGTRENLAPTDGKNLETGDRIVMKTPGGGGFGKILEKI